ncbi:MAG: glutathione S-transferase N-terminal domain-containing protein [Aestuariivita sp.]|nr:glutathione S-transferase N-terminal domain-containing protein [Aestuariivita sp.]
MQVALNLKRLSYCIRSVDLASGKQRKVDYTALNPIVGVPTLVLEDERALTKSMAILEWLDKTYPKVPLLPKDTLACTSSCSCHNYRDRHSSREQNQDHGSR